MVFTILVYFAIVIPLLIIHETVPAAPSDPVRFNGLNLTEAWLDLSELTNGFHPYNSKRNDEIHDWLLRRIEGILADNDIDWETGKAGSIPRKFSVDMDDEKTESEKPFPGFIVVESGEMLVAKKAAQEDELRKRDDSPLVTIFNDLQSNVTASALGGRQADGRGRIPGQTVYFEGNNIIVYIRGTEDEEGKWWESDLSMMKKVHGQGEKPISKTFRQETNTI